jgi:malonyl-ACP O-methyltransferase BioC
MIDKKRILQSFQRAADSYEEQAMIQHKVADYLLNILQECHSNEINRVLEIGCCTGLLTRKLAAQYPEIMEIVLNDLVESFVTRAGDLPGVTAVSFLTGDIETLPLSGRFDLIISSSTFHWIHDLDKVLHKLSGHLNPGATLAFSLYGPDNLQEIRELTGLGINYSSLAQVRQMVSRYFTVDHSSEQLETFYFKNPGEVLTHLRQTGVNALSNTPWTPRRLQRFKEEYRKNFSAPQGVRLSYHPLYLLAHL